MVEPPVANAAAEAVPIMIRYQISYRLLMSGRVPAVQAVGKAAVVIGFVLVGIAHAVPEEQRVQTLRQRRKGGLLFSQDNFQSSSQPNRDFPSASVPIRLHLLI